MRGCCTRDGATLPGLLAQGKIQRSCRRATVRRNAGELHRDHLGVCRQGRRKRDRTQPSRVVVRSPPRCARRASPTTAPSPRTSGAAAELVPGRVGPEVGASARVRTTPWFSADALARGAPVLDPLHGCSSSAASAEPGHARPAPERDLSEAPRRARPHRSWRHRRPDASERRRRRVERAPWRAKTREIRGAIFLAGGRTLGYRGPNPPGSLHPGSTHHGRLSLAPERAAGIRAPTFRSRRGHEAEP